MFTFFTTISYLVFRLWIKKLKNCFLLNHQIFHKISNSVVLNKYINKISIPPFQGCWHFGQVTVYRVCMVACSVASLPLADSSTRPPPPSHCDNQKCFQTLPDVSWEQSHSWWRACSRIVSISKSLIFYTFNYFIFYRRWDRDLKVITRFQTILIIKLVLCCLCGQRDMLWDWAWSCLRTVVFNSKFDSWRQTTVTTFTWRLTGSVSVPRGFPGAWCCKDLGAVFQRAPCTLGSEDEFVDELLGSLEKSGNLTGDSALRDRQATNAGSEWPRLTRRLLAFVSITWVQTTKPTVKASSVLKAKPV